MRRLKTLLKLSLPVLGALALSGCALHIGEGTFGDTYRIMKIALNPENVRITRDQAASVPYPSLGYTIGDSPENMLVLIGSANPGNQLWSAGRQVALIFRYHRITRTAGLNHNLESLSPLMPDVTADTDWFHDGEKIWQMMIAGNDGAIRLDCRHHDAGPDTVKIIGSTIAVDRIEEHCVSQTPSVPWDFTNIFWIDRNNGVLWKARQYLHPGMKPLTYEIFRQPLHS